MTSYLTSTDTFSLSHTVFEIFDFEVSRVWPLTFDLKRSPGVKNIFTIRKLIHDFLSDFYRHFLSISYRFRENSGQNFQCQTKWRILTFSRSRSLTDIFHFLKKGLTLAKRRRMTYCASKSVQPFWLHPHQRANFKNLLEKVLTRRTRTRRRTWIVTLKTLTNDLVIAILALTVVSARLIIILLLGQIILNILELCLTQAEKFLLTWRHRGANFFVVLIASTAKFLGQTNLLLSPY